MVIPIEQLTNDYIKYLKSTGASLNTIKNYNICLNLLIDNFGNLDAKNFDTKHFNILEKAIENKVSGDDRKIKLRYFKSLRYFLQWCVKNGYDVGLNSEYVYSKDKRLQESLYEEQRQYEGVYITEVELAKLNLYWEKESNDKTLLALRNRAIVYLLGDAGLKPGEVVKLKRENFSGAEINFGTRNILLSNKCNTLISNYLSRRPDSATDMVVGYSSRDKNKIKTHPLSIREIQRIVKNTSDEVGIEGKITPQALRNSRLIRALLDEMSFEDIKSYFGFSKSNSSYQRFLAKAKELKGIEVDAINTSTLALKLNIPKHKALQLIKSGEIRSIRFRNNYFISPEDFSQYTREKVGIRKHT